MNYFLKLFFSLAILLLLLIIIHYSNFDLKFQAFFYNNLTSSWFVDRDDQLIKFIFYRFPKYLLMVYGVLMIIWGIKLRIYSENTLLEKKLLFLVLSLIFVPLIIATLKHYSPIYCPNHIKEFGGWAEHISPINLFKSENFSFHTGKCFPAGHASGGFALISLSFVMPNRRSNSWALFFAIILGWIMGLYQIAKGAHYFSDTLVSMILSYLICLSLYNIIFRKKLLENNQ